MKKVFLALFAIAFVVSICFVVEAAVLYTTNNSTNSTQIFPNMTAIPAQASNTTIVPTQLSGMTPAPVAAKGIVFVGKVNSVSSGSGISGVKPQMTVTDDKGRMMIFVVAADTVIIGKDGNPTTLNWIGGGDKVSIEYISNQDGTETAKSIKVSSGW